MSSNPTPAEAHWYLIQCKPREDERAFVNLERQSYHCYRPTQKAERFPHGRRQVVTESLFPGYLFIRLDQLNDNWRPIRSTRGVNRIVAFNGDPTVVPDTVLAAIRSRLESENGIVRPRFKPGDRVCVVDGPFAHLEGIFAADSGEARVVLLLNILQREQEIQFPADSVRKIS